MEANLLDLGLALEVLASDQFGNIVLVTVLALLALLHALVALGQLAQRGQGVGAELVENAGHELGQLLVLAGAVDGESVCGDGSVDCGRPSVSIQVMTLADPAWLPSALVVFSGLLLALFLLFPGTFHRLRGGDGGQPVWWIHSTHPWVRQSE